MVLRLRQFMEWLLTWSIYWEGGQGQEASRQPRGNPRSTKAQLRVAVNTIERLGSLDDW